MSQVLDELLSMLALEPIEKNLFRGQSQDLGWGRVYGGQVLGQALSAAYHTVPEGRRVHSMHAYFLLPGDVTRPIVYDVDQIRDGSSFTTRRVVAIQNGRAIFHMSASFQAPEDGFEHQDTMPDVPPPESLASEREHMTRHIDRLPAFLRRRALSETPFEIREVDPLDDLVAPSPRPPQRSYWIRTVKELPDSPDLHRYLLAYASDNNFLITALQPHGLTWLSPGIQLASLDHVMWFHGDFRIDDWLLYTIDSPVAGGARGLVRGRVFTPDGRLVVSTMQEGLMRYRQP